MLKTAISAISLLLLKLNTTLITVDISCLIVDAVYRTLEPPKTDKSISTDELRVLQASGTLRRDAPRSWLQAVYNPGNRQQH